MFEVRIISGGTTYNLTTDPRFSVINVDGLTPPPVTVNTSANAGDGSFFNSAYVQPRNIVMTVVFNGDIETTRKAFYDIVPIKKSIKFAFINKNRAVLITGYVESIDIPLFSQRQQAQVSIICPNPWLPKYGGESQNFTNVDSSYLKCLVEYTGDVETGVIVSSSFTGSATGYTLTNVTTGDTFALNYVFQNGDYLFICSRFGELYVRVRRNGSYINLTPYIVSGSRWIKIQRGTNELRVTMSTGLVNTSADVNYIELYGGV